ncbi:hypothetical protein FSP39_009838 [Pinctada imbricata]|uniref:Reticulocalbin-3 n=1 Tax=Pinctada imbricata TaxID=66713 RepID=A0AA89C5W6_PINIB|nr:hypothetical protein FSP39_009838 [Pinctada imbricata]
MVQEVYPLGNRFLPTSFMMSGFTPDPRTHTPIIRDMNVYPDDVLICAYVKAGTHLVWEITKMLLKGDAQYDPSPKEVAMLEFHSMDILENIPRPRALNSHKPVGDIPQTFRKGVGKVIFVQRNPKDIAVSFYNHMKNTRKGAAGTWEDFVFLTNTYGGFSSDWYQYTLEFEEEFKTNKDMKWHNMYYEDIKKNPTGAIKGLARFLEVPCSDQLAHEIADKCSFSQMKNANENFKFDHVNNSKPNPEFENPGAMYRKEPFDPEKIIRRKCPSGMVLELYPAANRLQTLQFLKLGLTPDPRTHHPAIREMTIYPDDVIICAYVKAGTHWVWEMTKMLLKGEAEYDPSPKEVAMLEFHPLDLFENMARPRVLNTHNTVPDLPNALRDGTGRMIFVQRNPKDVAVSFYNHLANMKGGFKGTWEDYAYLFNNFGGYHNDWFKYTLGFDEELKSNKKMKYHMMYYEDIKKDPLKSIHELAKFLEVKCSDQLSMEIADKCSFTRLKHASENLKFDHINNTKPNSEFENPGAMYRKGEIGDWKNWFTVAQSEEFNQMKTLSMKLIELYLIVALIAITYSSAIPKPGEDHKNTAHEQNFGDIIYRIIVDKIDKNKDGSVTETELKEWVQYVQKRYIVTDTERMWKDHDTESDKLTWNSYKKRTYGYEDDPDHEDSPTFSYKDMIERDERRWKVADKNKDGFLDKEEFADFLHPEEAEHMRDIVVQETMEDIDKDKDGFISLEEYIADVYDEDEEDEDADTVPDDDHHQAGEPDWVKSERDQFVNHRDKNFDGKLDVDEVRQWVIPEDYDHSGAEATHLVTSSDDNKVGDMWPNKEEGEPEWVATEREQFKSFRDKNSDGKMDNQEVKEWIIPPDYDHSEAEAKHLINESDSDKDGVLSKEEILEHYDLFVGSQATDFGEALTRHDEF